jgi:hypothetical protein
LDTIPNLTTRLPHTVSLENLQSGLEAALAARTIPPPSLSSVTKELGGSRRAYARFPELAHAISARYLAYRAEQQAENLNQFRNKVTSTTIRLHSEGIYPAMKTVARAMGNLRYKREKEFRVAWREARDAVMAAGGGTQGQHA